MINMEKKIVLTLFFLLLMIFFINPISASTIEGVDVDPQKVTPGDTVNISISSDGIAIILGDIPNSWVLLDNSSGAILPIEDNQLFWGLPSGDGVWAKLQIPKNAKTGTSHTLNASVRGNSENINIDIVSDQKMGNVIDQYSGNDGIISDSEMGQAITCYTIGQSCINRKLTSNEMGKIITKYVLQ